MSTPGINVVRVRASGSKGAGGDDDIQAPKQEIIVQEHEGVVEEIEMAEEEEEEGISAIAAHIEQKEQDPHVNVQIIAAGQPAAKRIKGDDSTQEYLIIEQPAKPSEADETLPTEEDAASSQNDISVDADTVRNYGKKPQKYRTAWEAHPSLKDWLVMVPGNHYRAWCRLCACPLITQLKVLLDHSRCRKHVRRLGRPLQDPPANLGPQLTRSASSWGAKKESQQLDVSYGDQDRVTYSIGLGTQRVGFIGAGKIAQAIAMGMMNKGLTASNCVFVSAPTDRNLSLWKRWRCKSMSDNSALVRACDVVFLCVAPADLETVIVNLEAPGDNLERCFISTVSGVPHEKLTQMLTEVMPDEQVHVIRCVPSKTVAIGEGVCVYCAAADLPHTWLLAMETIFSALGLCQKVDESLMNVHSGAFSSGPAYVATFIDALAAGAANHGVRWEDAVQMAAQVTQGTASLILTQGMHPASIRREVCAAGGNTLAGMMALHKAGMEFAVMSAVDDATKKAKDLGSDPQM